MHRNEYFFVEIYILYNLINILLMSLAVVVEQSLKNIKIKEEQSC